MKLKFAFTIFVALFLTALPKSARAYFVATVSGETRLSSRVPTHILVSGRGENLGTQPQMSALGVAARIRQAHPDEQVVLMSVFENEKNRKSLEDRGIKFIKIDDKVTFDTASIMPELLKFKQIASLHFFGHNSPTLGTQSDGQGQRFDFRSRKLAELKSHFTTDAYLFIHGCNGGWILAPMLSKSLQIPVAGAFTGTHFERLHEDQNFYVASDKRAPTPNWARSNAVSFNADRTCSYGGCLRMRPSNNPYSGHWGDLRETGLGFYKFFCVGIEQTKCDRVMARSLLNSLTPANPTRTATRNEYLKAAKDMVCPPSKDRSVSKACDEAMEKVLSGGDKTYSSFGRIPALQCTFQSCEAKFSCTDATCTLEKTGKGKATTQAEEFLAYMRGFDELLKVN